MVVCYSPMVAACFASMEVICQVVDVLSYWVCRISPFSLKLYPSDLCCLGYSPLGHPNPIILNPILPVFYQQVLFQVSLPSVLNFNTYLLPPVCSQSFLAIPQIQEFAPYFVTWASFCQLSDQTRGCCHLQSSQIKDYCLFGLVIMYFQSCETPSPCLYHFDPCQYFDTQNHYPPRP